ncbi:MAG: amidohydrolase family protein, partial [Ignavibacteriota bacterium]
AFFLQSALFGAHPVVAQEFDYCIHKVTIISPESTNPNTSNQDVFIKAEKIVKITPASIASPINCTNLIDGRGKFLMAGLTDMHVHLPAEHIEKFMLLNLAAGVTTIRSMRGKTSHIELKRRISSGELIGPDLQIASPYFPNKNIKINDLADSIQGYKAAGYDCIKVLAVPDSNYYEALMKAAAAASLPVVGHWPWQVPIDRVIRSGYYCIEHLQGIENRFEADSNSIVALAQELKAHNTFNCPTLDYYKVVYSQAPLEELQKRPGLEYIDTATISDWTETVSNSFTKLNAGSGDSVIRKKAKLKNYIDMRYRLVKKLNDLGAKMIMSPAEANDPFGVPGFCVWEEMKLFAKAGISNKDILKISTYNAAEYSHATDKWGSIKAGLKANLLLLNKNPLESIDNISAQQGVFVAGKYYSQQELKKQIQR